MASEGVRMGSPAVPSRVRVFNHFLRLRGGGSFAAWVGARRGERDGE